MNCYPDVTGIYVGHWLLMCELSKLYLELNIYAWMMFYVEIHDPPTWNGWN